LKALTQSQVGITWFQHFSHSQWNFFPLFSDLRGVVIKKPALPRGGAGLHQQMTTAGHALPSLSSQPPSPKSPEGRELKEKQSL